MTTKIILVGKVAGNSATLTVPKDADLEAQAILSLIDQGYSRIVIKNEINRIIVEGYNE